MVIIQLAGISDWRNPPPKIQTHFITHLSPLHRPTQSWSFVPEHPKEFVHPIIPCAHSPTSISQGQIAS